MRFHVAYVCIIEMWIDHSRLLMASEMKECFETITVINVIYRMVCRGRGRYVSTT